MVVTAAQDDNQRMIPELAEDSQPQQQQQRASEAQQETETLYSVDEQWEENPVNTEEEQPMVEATKTQTTSAILVAPDSQKKQEPAEVVEAAPISLPAETTSPIVVEPSSAGEPVEEEKKEPAPPVPPKKDAHVDIGNDQSGAALGYSALSNNMFGKADDYEDFNDFAKNAEADDEQEDVSKM